MTDENLNYFYEILKQAIDEIEPAYMRTIYGEMDMILNLVENESQRHNLEANMIGDNLFKSGERIFCYELYHQLRLLMRDERERFGNTLLQAELRKHQIMPLLNRMGLLALSGDFIPDFLLHTPGNAEDHAFVIEVKTNSALTYRQLAADISKLVEFITRYGYQRGVFLSINISAIRLREIISNCRILRLIPHLDEVADKIMIMGRENEFSQAFDFSLNEVLIF